MDEIVCQEQIMSGWPDMQKNPGCKLALHMWLKFLIQGSSTSESINRKDLASGRSIFSRTLLPSIFLILIDCTSILLLHLKEKREGEDWDDGGGGRFALASVSLLRPCLVTSFSWQGPIVKEDRLCSSYDLICSNISSFGGGYGWSEVLLRQQRWWILIPLSLHMPSSLRFMLNPMVVALETLFLR